MAFEAMRRVQVGVCGRRTRSRRGGWWAPGVRLGALGSSRRCWQSPEGYRQGSGEGRMMGVWGLPKIGSRMEEKGEEEGNI